MARYSFQLNEVFDVDAVLSLPGYEHCDGETGFATVVGIAEFERETLAPCNSVGDSPGPTWIEGAPAGPTGQPLFVAPKFMMNKGGKPSASGTQSRFRAAKASRVSTARRPAPL